MGCGGCGVMHLVSLLGNDGESMLLLPKVRPCAALAGLSRGGAGRWLEFAPRAGRTSRWRAHATQFDRRSLPHADRSGAHGCRNDALSRDSDLHQPRRGFLPPAGRIRLDDRATGPRAASGVGRSGGSGGGGRISSDGHAGTRFFFKPTTARILGRGSMPEPVRTSLPAALNGGTAGRWVEIEGVVMQSALQNGVVTLHLADASGWAVVNVHDWRAGLSLREGWGARLRVRCANVGRGHAALRVSSSDQITVIAPGTAELFAAPLADPAALPAGGARADRLRLTGTVLAQQGEYIYLRSGQGPALRASVLQPFHAAEGTHPLELIPPPLPKALTPGDRVELVGSLLVVAPFVQFSFAAFRRLSAGELPPAISATDRDPTALACDHVTLKGRILWHESATAAGALEKLAMDCCGTTIHAEVLPAADSAASPGTSPTRFQADDLIEATGVLFPAEHGRLFMLRDRAAPGSATAGIHLPGPPRALSCGVALDYRSDVGPCRSAGWCVVAPAPGPPAHRCSRCIQRHAAR